ncbi:flagellar export protein FliJ [Sporomusa termitida]|uniref:Flagellar FliJ protein n=1 Tax=Sporomusa termitida TaxID=2377 RepID=A0A517DT19_9FIRM|nr:flagellar export protein FliJ [Sporomusa termitida]QDR80491.1 flagellar export protein FliJ [Sporomusa termitida]
MKKFRFRLETLLKFRQMQEDQAQVRLAEATESWQQEQAQLAGLHDNLAANLALFSQQQSTGSLPVETLKIFSDYTDKINRMISDQQIQVAKAASRRQECLSVLERAIQQRQLVSNLREKCLDRYKEELLQDEQKILDELGTQAFGRNRGRGIQ